MPALQFGAVTTGRDSTADWCDRLVLLTTTERVVKPPAGVQQACGTPAGVC